MNKQPNILFILSDQHSPHVTGWEGNQSVDTPRLDELASEGVAFRNMYCQNPLCVPSRASLMTGQYSRTTGIYDNMHIMQANITTLPRTLSKNGYKTCLIGKSHFNGEQYHGYQQRPYGDIYGQGHQPDPERLPKFGINGLGGAISNNGPSEMPVELTQTEICVAEASKWLQLHKSGGSDQPFMLSVHFDKPHFPIRPPGKYYDKYKGKLKLPEVSEDLLADGNEFVREGILHNGTGHHYNKDHDIQLKALESYYACVEWVDDAAGRIIDVLDYLGYKEDTLVIYSSDHGEMGGEHGTWMKTLFYEASARVPMVMRWPGVIKAGSVSDGIAGLIDMFPTICDAAGIEIPEECEGISLIPHLKDGAAVDREGIFSESAVLLATEYAGCMYRTGTHKYCYYIDGSEELYDLAADPDELNDLASNEKYTELVLKYRKTVKDFWKPEEYMERLAATPIMCKEKHFYEFSNQFITGDGRILDARP